MSTRPKKNLFKEKSPYGDKNIKSASKKRSNSHKLDVGSYRVIGGQWRSRRLSFPAIEGLRPTTDRVRETLFNWLSSDIVGASVLDVFSGSGALGFESLSRGASSLVAIEKNKAAAQALEENFKLLHKSETNKSAFKVEHADALSFLALLKGSEEGASKINVVEETPSFDIVFIDPPFRKGLLEETLALLDGHPKLSENALIYIEFEKEMTGLTLPRNWSLLKDKIAGQVSYRLYRVKPK